MGFSYVSIGWIGLILLNKLFVLFSVCCHLVMMPVTSPCFTINSLYFSKCDSVKFNQCIYKNSIYNIQATGIQWKVKSSFVCFSFKDFLWLRMDNTSCFCILVSNEHIQRINNKHSQPAAFSLSKLYSTHFNAKDVSK